MARGTWLSRGLTITVGCAVLFALSPAFLIPGVTVVSDARRWMAVRETRALVQPSGEIIDEHVRWDRGMSACFGEFRYRVRLTEPADTVQRRVNAQAEAEGVEVMPDGDAHVVRIYKFVNDSRWDMGCD